eukprot:snap_masked-scaffold_22-processed-gene-4.45-mRNA-1 protein AED:1.00 eAED:1.00 QI:0/0/0/0/1/1/4/0/65
MISLPIATIMIMKNIIALGFVRSKNTKYSLRNIALAELKANLYKNNTVDYESLWNSNAFSSESFV